MSFSSFKLNGHFGLRFVLAFLYLAIAQADDLLLPAGGVSYTNYQVAQVPWSIHVVQVDRADANLEIQSRHAKGGALGLSTLTDQIRLAKRANAVPVAAVNGD